MESAGWGEGNGNPYSVSHIYMPNLHSSRGQSGSGFRARMPSPTNGGAGDAENSNDNAAMKARLSKPERA